jgi:hypothetical protein
MTKAVGRVSSWCGLTLPWSRAKGTPTQEAPFANVKRRWYRHNKLLHRVTVTVHMGNNETHVCTLDHFLNATRIDDLYRCASKERKQGAMHGHDPPRQKQHWRA